MYVILYVGGKSNKRMPLDTLVMKTNLSFCNNKSLAYIYVKI